MGCSILSSRPGLINAWRSAASASPIPKALKKGREEDLEVLDDPVMGDPENGRLWILIDRDDDLGILHASQMLNGSRDPEGEVETGAYGLAGYPDLVFRRKPTAVTDRAGGAQGRAFQEGEELPNGREGPFIPDPTTSGHHDRSPAKTGFPSAGDLLPYRAGAERPGICRSHEDPARRARSLEAPGTSLPDHGHENPLVRNGAPPFGPLAEQGLPDEKNFAFIEKTPDSPGQIRNAEPQGQGRGHGETEAALVEKERPRIERGEP